MHNVIQLDVSRTVVGEFAYETLPDFVGVHSDFMVKPLPHVSVGWRFIDDNWLEPLPVQETVASVGRLESYQAKMVLAEYGLLNAVEALIQHPDTPVKVKVLWDSSVPFRRENPLVLLIASQLALSDELLDELFLVGAGISADTI